LTPLGTGCRYAAYRLSPRNLVMRLLRKILERLRLPFPALA
jgi:hypothetical protein